MLDPTMRTLQAAMGGLQARQRVIAQNIANVETPGYLAGRVAFEDSLREAIADGDPGAMEISTRPSLDATRMNGSNVNLDEENLELIDTGLRYQLMVEAMNAKFRLLRTSLRNDT